MARPKQIIRDGKKWCDYHKQWEDTGDFETVRRDMDVPIYAARCRLAQQTIRDNNRMLDPARASIITRAKSLAGDLSKALGVTISYHFVLDELLWSAFTPVLRVLIAPGGTCTNCGRHHDDPRRWDLAHAYPAESITDWPAQHARNLSLMCHGCNLSQGPRPSDRQWLEREQHKWMLDRDWPSQAGQPGWPPYDPRFGTIPDVVVVDGPCDQWGRPTLF